MSDPVSRRPRRRSSGSEHLFEDTELRLWSASESTTPRGGGAVIFTCISDAREPARALAAAEGLDLDALPAQALLALLREAPRIGQLP